MNKEIKEILERPALKEYYNYHNDSDYYKNHRPFTLIGTLLSLLASLVSGVFFLVGLSRNDKTMYILGMTFFLVCLFICVLFAIIYCDAATKIKLYPEGIASVKVGKCKFFHWKDIKYIRPIMLLIKFRGSTVGKQQYILLQTKYIEYKRMEDQSDVLSESENFAVLYIKERYEEILKFWLKYKDV